MRLELAFAALLLTAACGGGGGGTGGGGGGLQVDAYVKAPNPAEFAQFGHSVAISGDTMVVGAPSESGSGTTVDAPFDEGKPSSGAAYVYVRTGDTWALQAYLKASNSDESDQFGWSVAVSGDRIVVGAPTEDGGGAGVDPADDDSLESAGAAYVFVRVMGVWVEEARLKATNPGGADTFGARVAISGDTVAVATTGEAGSGSGVNPPVDELAGAAGAVYVFARTMAGWAFEAYVKSMDAAPNERFGGSVAIEGDTLVVGASADGRLSLGDPMTDPLGNGAAFVYARVGGTWSASQKLVAPNADEGDQFGDSVGVWGETIVVGANGEDGSGTTVNAADDDLETERGAAYVFVLDGGVWTPQAYLKPGTPAGGQFGIAAAVSGDVIVVGTNATNVVHLFTRSGTTWTGAGALTAPAPGRFGVSVALDGTTAVAGAPYDAGSGSGINPPHDLLLELSGAAYVGDL